MCPLVRIVSCNIGHKEMGEYIMVIQKPIEISVDTNMKQDEHFAILENYGDLLNTRNLSELLGVSVQTVYKEIRNGKFGEPIKFGREYRVPKKYIYDNYIHQHQR